MNNQGTSDERTPVIVGIGQINQRVDHGEPSLEPIGLMEKALRLAAEDCGRPRILAELQALRAINVFGWRYQDPARLVADAVGCPSASTTYTHIGGNVPQMVMNAACRDIAAGEVELVAITGAEAGCSKAMAKRSGRELDWTVQDPQTAPDNWADSDMALLLDTEMLRGVLMPIQIYPLFESAWRAQNGWSLDQNRRRIAEVTARLSDVSVDNPHAWNRVPHTADEIDSPDNGNRMVGFPYRKIVNSFERVDQGAALIVTNVAKARALGIPSDKWVFPVAGTDAMDTQYMSNRVSFATSGAIGIAGRRALELADIDPLALTHVDVYSCFPVAVQVAAHELGLDIERRLTVTGGLPFAGGPWSDYVSHSIARSVELLRHTGGTALVTANGGFFTKHAFGVYASEPSEKGFQWERPQDEIDALGSVEVIEGYSGDAIVESCTVMHGRDDTPEQAIITGRTASGSRVWATSTDPDTMARIETVECVSSAARIDEAGTFTFR